MPDYNKTRLDRIAEQKSSKKLLYSIAAGIAVLFFLAIWGVPALISMSVFISGIGQRNEPQVKQADTTPLFAPTLEPLYEATNSSPIAIRGYTEPEIKVELYLNDELVDKISASESGSFKFEEVNLQEGQNRIWVKSIKDGRNSEKSEIINMLYKKTPPKIEVKTPEDGSTVSGEKKSVMISGITDLDNNVSINDHIVIVNADGSFSYEYPLADGDNTLKIKATDKAGNFTEMERKVKYSSG